MKKLFSIFMALLFVTSLSFASVETNEFDDIDPECYQYGKNAANAEEAAYGAMGYAEWAYTAMSYYDDCMAAGGANNILMPVFL